MRRVDRRAAGYTAALAGVPPDVLAAAMDAAQRLPRMAVTFPPEEQERQAAALGFSASCRSATTVLARLRHGLLIPVSGPLGGSSPCSLGSLGGTGRAVGRSGGSASGASCSGRAGYPAAAAGSSRAGTLPPAVPILDWAARQEAGLATLRAGRPIPPAWVDAVVHQHDWVTAAAWLVGGALHLQLEALGDVMLTDDPVLTLVRAGVVLTPLVPVLGALQSNGRRGVAHRPSICVGLGR